MLPISKCSLGRSHHRILGLFCAAKHSSFLFSKLQKRKLNAQSRSIKVYIKLRRRCRNKSKMDEVRFSLKEQKFGLTKQTHYMVYCIASNFNQLLKFALEIVVREIFGNRQCLRKFLTADFNFVLEILVFHKLTTIVCKFLPKKSSRCTHYMYPELNLSKLIVYTRGKKFL